MSANRRVVESNSKIISLITRKKSTNYEVKPLRKNSSVTASKKSKKSELTDHASAVRKVTEKSEAKTPIMKKRKTLLNRRKSLVSSPQKDDVEVKAKPFKKKMGFYVK